MAGDPSLSVVVTVLNKAALVGEPGQVDRHVGSTKKASTLLGWEARTAFEDGLERTVAWYRENEAWWRGILARETRAFSS